MLPSLLCLVMWPFSFLGLVLLSNDSEVNNKYTVQAGILLGHG